jgi:hypothetical protein
VIEVLNLWIMVTEPLSPDTAFQIHTEKIFDFSYGLPPPGLLRGCKAAGRERERRRTLADQFAGEEGQSRESERGAE